MAWEPLPTDYTDAVWSGPKKYIMIENDDGTVSFQDVTIYSNKEKSFFGANDANQMNQRANELAKSLLPVGGTAGQVLRKRTAADRDADWETLTASQVGALPANGTAEAADKLSTARAIRTNLASTSTASFDGSANITPGVTGTLPIANPGDSELLVTANSSGTMGFRYTLSQLKSYFGGSSISTPVSIANGGTGATTAANAIKNLGAAPITNPVFDGNGNVTIGTGSASYTGDNYGSPRSCLIIGSDNEVISNTIDVICGGCENSLNMVQRSVVFGDRNDITNDECSIVVGDNNDITGSVNALGNQLYADETNHSIGMLIIGTANTQSSYGVNTKFIVGSGAINTSTGSASSRSNCFRITTTGTYASGNYNASGADYAEMFEWADGNPDKEDRAGRFVTLDGAKIRLAGPNDDYIIGIVSGNPSIVGDVHDDQWQGMYLYDTFGRPLWEDVGVPEETDIDGHIIIPAHTEHRQKLNPDYDNSQPYQPRSERPEWDAVGMLGKLVAVDDGSCEVNGWCTVGNGGIAVRSENRTKYRVMERLDEYHIRVLIL